MTDEDYSLERTLPPLRDQVDGFGASDWEDIDRILLLGLSGPLAERSVRDLIDGLEGVFGEWQLASSFVFALSNWLSRGEEDLPGLSEQASAALLTLNRRYGHRLEKAIGLAMRGARDWSALDVSVVSGARQDKAVRVAVDRLDDSDHVIQTTLLGFVRLLRSLSAYLEDVVPELPPDEREEAASALRAIAMKARDQLKGLDDDAESEALDLN